MESVKNTFKKALGWSALAIVSTALIALIVATIGTLPGRILELSPVASQLKPVDRIKAESDIRASILQAIGGVLLLVGAITAWRQMSVSRRQHDLSSQTAVTEAFAKAVEQLANTASVAVRLGGAYSLDRIAQHHEAESGRVAEILAEFVREGRTSIPEKALTRDIRAALSVLARRDWPNGVDLAGITLKGVRLPHARLLGARLEGVDLSEADLTGAVLLGADLTGADLRRARLVGADLRHAKLNKARLSGAAADSRTRWPAGFDASYHGVLGSDQPHALE